MPDQVFPAKSVFPSSRKATQTKLTPGVAQQRIGGRGPAPATSSLTRAAAAPPVYRPQTSVVAQPKNQSAQNAGNRPAAPPVYRPRPEPIRKPLGNRVAAGNVQMQRSPRQFGLQAKMASSVIQRTVWEWDDGKQIWRPFRTEGLPTPPPGRAGSYPDERVSTGVEDPWAAIPERVVVAPRAAAVERDATWKSNTRLPLYAEAFGVEIRPNGCHSEEEILAQLTGKRSEKQDKATTKIWMARAAKIGTEKALNLELNAWPCCGSGDPDCHAKLSHFAATNGVTVTVKVVGDSGGYESGHHSKPNWVDGATKITYTGTTVTYSK